MSFLFEREKIVGKKGKKRPENWGEKLLTKIT